jgi:hypothetical protein
MEILPDYTITEENMEADMAGTPALGLVAGNTYIVKLQGTEYTCVAWETVSPDAGTVVGLGDLYTATGGEMGTAATGEPFALMEFSPEAAAQAGVNVMVQPLVEMSFPIVFSIIGEGETAHKLDNRCLDLAWLPTIVSNAEVLSPRTTRLGSTSFVDFNTVENPVGLPFVVHFNDEQYECTMRLMTENGGVGYVLGNTMIISGGFDEPGEPFCFLKVPDLNEWMAFFDVTKFVDGELNIAVYGPGYNKMPDSFLPKSLFKNEDESFILTSAENADGYRRKFRITISYDGTLSATAV